MRILQLEASPGWGGQEIRILQEAIGLKKKGYHILFALEQGGSLAKHAKEKGFEVFELRYQKRYALSCIKTLCSLIRFHSIDILNTHSSLDAWFGGVAARLLKKPVVRTRHLSTAIRKGWNSRLLYHKLADYVVTTCAEVVPMILHQSGRPASSIRSVPTGVDTSLPFPSEKEVFPFRKKFQKSPTDLVVGTVCFLRSWKGIQDFLQAALLLKEDPTVQWVIIGGGHEAAYREEAKRLSLSNVQFVGHLSSPYAAIAALDIFTLLSTSHEGVSQASLQAAFLKKPLITTPTGGLKEVCIPHLTGLQVPCFSPSKVAEAVLHLKKEPFLRKTLGERAHERVVQHFSWEQTLQTMEKIYLSLIRSYNTRLY